VSEATGRRIGGIAGIMSPVLWLGGMIATDIIAEEGASAEEIVSLLSERSLSLRIGAFLFGLSLLALIWFLGSLRDTLIRSEGGPGRLAVTAYGAGLIYVALDFLAISVFPGVLASEVFLAKADPDVVYTWFQIVRGSEPGLWETVAVGSTLPLVALFAAVSSSVRRSGGLPKWLGWFAALLAVLFAVTSLETLGGGIRQAAGAVGFPTYFLLFRVWLLAAGIALVVRPNPDSGTTINAA
jgi:hypothetical protein